MSLSAIPPRVSRALLALVPLTALLGCARFESYRGTFYGIGVPDTQYTTSGQPRVGLALRVVYGPPFKSKVADPFDPAIDRHRYPIYDASGMPLVDQHYRQISTNGLIGHKLRVRGGTKTPADALDHVTGQKLHITEETIPGVLKTRLKYITDLGVCTNVDFWMQDY